MKGLEKTLFEDTAQLSYLHNLEDFKVDEKEFNMLVNEYKSIHNLSIFGVIKNLSEFKKFYADNDFSIKFNGNYKKTLFGCSRALMGVRESDIFNSYKKNDNVTEEQLSDYAKSLSKSEFKYDRIPGNRILNGLK